MKKSLFSSVYSLVFALVLTLTSVMGWGQTTIFNYSGGGTVTGWTFTNNITTNDIDKTTYWLLDGNASNTDVIITSSYDLSSYTSATFSFNFRNYGTASSETVGKVEISYNGGSTYTQTATTPSTTNSYAAFSVVLSSLSSQVVFRITNGGGNNQSKALRLQAAKLVASGVSNTNTIATGAITGSPFCVSSASGVPVSVPFTSSGTFTSGNLFKAQLSDASGSFASAIDIGTFGGISTGIDLSGTISAAIPAGTAAGTGYRIRVVSGAPATTGSDNGASLTINNPAVITANPSTTARTYCQNETAAQLSVTATGAVSYQWYSNATNNNTSGISLGAGAQTNTYTPSTTSVGTLYYYCVVTGSCGSAVTSTVSGSHTVNASPYAPVAANIVVAQNCGSTILTYSGTVPTGETFYWQTSVSGESTSNSTTTGYSIPSNGTYYLRSYNGSCWSTAVSKATSIILAPTISSQPVSTSVVAPAAASFSVAASNASGYQWQLYNAATSTWDDISAAINSSYSTGATTVAMNGNQYRVIVKGNTPCGNVTSSVAKLTVNAAPVPKTYELVTSATQLVAGKKYLLVSAKYSGSTSSISAYALGYQNGTYRSRASISISNENKITVLPATSNSNTSSPFEMTLGGSTGSWTFQDAANSNNYFNASGTNQLTTVNTNNANGVFTIVLDLISFNTTITASGTNTGKIMSHNSSASRFSCYATSQDDVYLYVESSCATSPGDPVGNISGTTPACNSTTLTYNGTDKAIAYWVSSPTGKETNEPASADKTVTTSGTYYLRIKDGECWSNNTINRTIEINSAITIATQPTDATVTNNATASFVIVANGGGITYQWEVSTDCGQSWSTISGATAASLDILSSNSLYANGNRFRVKVSNTCTTLVTSNIITLYIVVSANAVDTNFSSAEGWTDQSYSTWNQSIEGIVWEGANIAVSNSNGLQFQYSTTNGDSSVEFSLIDNPLSITFKGGLKTTTPSNAENNTIVLQYYDTNSSAWITLHTENYTVNPTAHNTTVSLSTLTQLKNLKFRFYRSTNGTGRAVYISSVLVNKKIITDYTWTGGANTTSWDDLCNWSPKGIPSANDNVIFSNNTVAANTLNITDSRSINNITMSGSGHFSVNATGSLIINGSSTYDGTAYATLNCNSTVQFASTSAVTLPPLSYGNLNIIGGPRTFPAGLVQVCNTLTSNTSTTSTVTDGSTIEYNGADQSISAFINYYNIKFSGSGTKTPNNAISVNTNGTVTITGTPIVNFSGRNLASISSNSTKFVMDGGRLRLGTAELLPNMGGNYTITGGTIEFTNNAKGIRTPNTYNNIEITVSFPNEVIYAGGNLTLNPNASVLLKSGATLTSSNGTSSLVASGGTQNGQQLILENNAKFRTASEAGFYGPTAGGNPPPPQPSVRDNIALNLDPGSTIEYARLSGSGGLPAGASSGDQQIVALPNGYPNLKIIGDDTKTAKGDVTVNGMTTVASAAATLLVPEYSVAGGYSNLSALGGINNGNEATGEVILGNDATLMQNASADNSNARIKMFRNIERRNGNEYDYLISPLIGQNLSSIYSATGSTLYYNEKTDFFANSTGAYIRGRGLAVKEPAVQTNASFFGQPFNETFSYALAKQGDGYNLVGNPYPSNLDLYQFYQDNSANINHDFLFWDKTVNTFNYQMGSGYYGYAYAKYSATTGTFGTGNAAVQGPIIGTKTPGRYVKVGQGFMLQAKFASNLQFSHGQRSKLHSSTVFFGKNNASDDRYWFGLKTPAGMQISNAVVYFPNGKNAFAIDDSKVNFSTSDALYTLVDAERVDIQGKAPFIVDDQLPVGYKGYSAGTYKFSLLRTEGIFAEGQAIYIHDKALNVFTNLQEGPYSFEGQGGVNENRFEIVYKLAIVLGTEGTTKKNVIVYREGNDFIVESKGSPILEVDCYDSAGRLVKKVVDHREKVALHAQDLPSGLYLLQIKHQQGTSVKRVLK